MIVRRVASASRRQAAPGGGGTSSPALASSATRDEAVPVADPVALRNRIDALRGAVFAMREIHDALVGRLQVVRQMAGTQPGTEGRSHDFEVNNAIHDSLRLRAEILRMAAERTDGGSASADDDDNDDDIDDLDGAAPPASTAAIAALKRFTKLSVDTTVICPVCQEAPNGTRRWVQLPACRHEYCEECAVQWLSLSRTCPTCRAEVTTPRVIATEHHSFNGDRHPDAVVVPSPQAVVCQSTSRLATLRGLPSATAAEADHHKVRGPIVAPLSSQLHQRLSMLSTPGAPGTPGTLAALRTTPLSRTPAALRPSSAKPLLQAAASNMDDSGLAVMPSRLLTLRRPGSAASRTPQSSMTDAVRRSPPLSSTTTNVAAQRSVSAAGQGLSATLRPSSAVLLRPPSASGTTHRRGGVSPKREAAPSTTTRVDDTAGLLVGARLTLSQRPQSATRPLRVGSASQRPQPAAGIVFSTTTTGRPPRHM